MVDPEHCHRGAGGDAQASLWDNGDQLVIRESLRIDSTNIIEADYRIEEERYICANLPFAPLRLTFYTDNFCDNFVSREAFICVLRQEPFPYR